MSDGSLASETQATIAHRESTTQVSTALIIELADRTNTDVDDLPPLYETIDPDALDRLLERDSGELTVTFDYAGYRINVAGDGRLAFAPESTAE